MSNLHIKELLVVKRMTATQFKYDTALFQYFQHLILLQFCMQMCFSCSMNSPLNFYSLLQCYFICTRFSHCVLCLLCMRIFSVFHSDSVQSICSVLHMTNKTECNSELDDTWYLHMFENAKKCLLSAIAVCLRSYFWLCPLVMLSN